MPRMCGSLPCKGNFKIVCLLLLLFVSGCISGKVIKEKLEGPYNVTRVIDGDTIDINISERVRLSGINSAERGECYYREAKDKLIELVYGKDIFLEKDKSNRGKYGRLLRYVYVDGLDVNRYLVEYGYVKVNDKYKHDIKRYKELKEVEREAIESSLGIWNYCN